MKCRTNKTLEAAIDRLADRLEYGHLLASMGGAELLQAAADEIDRLKVELARMQARIESNGKTCG